MNFKRLQFLEKNLHVCAAGVLLLVLLFGAWFTWPSADDFCYRNRAISLGVWNLVQDEFFNWGGRYSATALMGIFSHIPGFITGESYFIAPLFVLFSLWGGTYIFVRFALELQRPLFISLAAFICFVGALSWREGIFWMAGGITYGLGITFSMTVAGLIVLLKKNNSSTLIALLGTVIVGAGFNEMSALFNVVLIGLCGLFFLKKIFIEKKQFYKNAYFCTIALVFFVAVVCLLCVYLAPGNIVRSEHMSRDYVLPEILNGLLYPFNYTLNAACFFILWICLFSHARPTQLPVWVPSNGWHILALTYLMMVPGLSIRALVLSGPGPDRVLGTDLLIVWIGMAALALHLYAAIPPLSHKFRVLLFVTVLLAMPSVSGMNTYEQFANLLRYAPKVSQSFEARLVQYQGALGQQIVVQRIKSKWLQSPTMMADLDENENHWINRCVAETYGLRSVSLQVVR